MAALTDHGSIEIEGAPPLSWGAAWRAKTLGQPCGDRHLVRRAGATVMIAVIDGTGSGPMAAQAAAACHAALDALDAPLEMDRCFAAAHRGCRETAGVALGVALIEMSARRLTWSAVGDIDGLLVRHASRPQVILQCGGTVGLHLPAILCQTYPLAALDTLIMVSDGVRHGNRGPVLPSAPFATLPASLLESHGRADDDAIVLAARVGAPA